MNVTRTTNCWFVQAPSIKLTQTLIISTAATVSLNISLAFAACLGNSGVILAYCKNKRLRTNANFLLVCLALTDLLVGVLVQPLFAAQEISVMAQTTNCVVLVSYTTSRVLCAILSVMTVLIISCERYLALFWPLRYNEFVTKPRIVITIGIAWLMWTTVVSTRFMGLPNKIFRLMCSVVIVCSHGISGLVYLRILRLARKHLEKIQRQGYHNEQTRRLNFVKEHKALKTTLYITGCLVTCYTPLVCLLLAVIVTKLTPELQHDLFAWADTLVFLNSSLNPCIYCWRNAEFRRTILSCFTRPHEVGNTSREITTRVGIQNEAYSLSTEGLSRRKLSKVVLENIKPIAQFALHGSNTNDLS